MTKKTVSLLSHVVTWVSAITMTISPFAVAQVPELIPVPMNGGQDERESKIPDLGGNVSMAEERALGDYIAGLIRSDANAYEEDPLLHDYVYGMWITLLDAARKDGELSPALYQQMAWEMFLIKDPTVNAFALPGAYVGVNLGLISMVSNKDELASVLAHESVHIFQRHIIRGIEKSKVASMQSIAAILLGILVAGANSNAGGAIISAGTASGIQGQINFTRQMEFEADRIGYKVLGDAGFRPEGMAEMFGLLMRKSSGDMSRFAYLSTHPLSEERIAEAQMRLGIDMYKEASSQDWLQETMSARALVLGHGKKTDLLIGNIQSAYNQKDHQPRANASVRSFYAGVMAASVLGDTAVADQLWNALLSKVSADENVYQVVVMLGVESALKRKNHTLAQQRLNLLPQQVGAEQARTALFLRAEVATASGQADDAIRLLQPWTVKNSRDMQAWRHLREAYQVDKQMLPSLRAEAEIYMLMTDYDRAVDIYRAALKQSGAVKASAYDIEIIQSRLKVAEAAQQARHQKSAPKI